MNIGKNFLKARQRKGVDQKHAAAALDISPSFLSKIERNKKKPSIELIMKAAEYYGVKEAFFFYEQDEIDINKLYTERNKTFMKDLGEMAPDEIQDKYNITLDGQELTKEEIKGLIAYLRQLRSVDE